MKKDEREPLAVEVGRRLSAAREAAGLNQIQLAQRLGFDSAANLSNWENGWAMLPPELAPKIFLITKIDSNYLYLDDPSGLPKALYDKLYPPQRQGKKSI